MTTELTTEPDLHQLFAIPRTIVSVSIARFFEAVIEQYGGNPSVSEPVNEDMAGMSWEIAQHLAAFEAAHRQMMQEAIFRPLPTRSPMNYYQMFGISPDASAEEN